MSHPPSSDRGTANQQGDPSLEFRQEFQVQQLPTHERLHIPSGYQMHHLHAALTAHLQSMPTNLHGAQQPHGAQQIWWNPSMTGATGSQDGRVAQVPGPQTIEHISSRRGAPYGQEWAPVGKMYNRGYPEMHSQPLEMQPPLGLEEWRDQHQHLIYAPRHPGTRRVLARVTRGFE